MKNNFCKIFIEKNICNNFKDKKNKKNKTKKIKKIKLITNGVSIKKNRFKILLIWDLFKKLIKMKIK